MHVQTADFPKSQICKFAIYNFINSPFKSFLQDKYLHFFPLPVQIL